MHRHGGGALLRPDLADLYDAFETPRARARRHPVPARAGRLRLHRRGARARAGGARRTSGRATARCSSSSCATRPSTTRRCARRCFSPACPAAGRAGRAARRAAPRAPPSWIDVPGGPFEMGAGPHGFAFDNERPRHRVDVAAVPHRAPAGHERAPGCTSARAAATSGASGGPTRAGRGRRSTTSRTPRAGRRAGRSAQTGPSCTSPGSRPTPSPVRKARAFPPKPSGRRRRPGPRSRSQQIGEAWEWTASRFAGYPGFVAHPYREYSEVFFGDRYRVLRGCSWATEQRVRSPTFRNWDLPERRQIFAGVRLAKDVT